MSRIFDHRDSGTWIEASGLVRRLIWDDNDGSRHQRFVLDMRNGQTILIAHNIDIAARVPVGIGGRLQFCGMYEWNDLGGLLHWTHHDPHGVEPGGCIKYRRQSYR